MLHVGFTVWFKSNADLRSILKAVERLEKRRGIVSAVQLANQYGGTTYLFVLSDANADGFQDALRGEKTVREFSRNDRGQED